MPPSGLSLKELFTASVRWFVAASLGLLLCSSLQAAQALRVAAWPEPDQELAEPLDAEQFHAWVEGKSVQVASAVGPGQPLVLLIVVDWIGDLNRIDRARAILTERFARLDPQWRVALLRAQDGLDVLQEPTDDGELLAAKLAETQTTGFAGLLDAIEPSARIAHRTLEQADVRTAVLFITDGSIRQYRNDYTAPVVNPSDRRDLSRRFGNAIIQEKIAGISDAVAQFAAPLYVVHLEERQLPDDQAYQNGLTEIAQQTGGEARFVRGVADVDAALSAVLDRIAQTYAVTLSPPANLRGAAKIRLEAVSGQKLAHRESFTFVQQKKKRKKAER